MKTIHIRAEWDPEAEVWVAESDDIGLATEAPTIEALEAKLPGMISDLLEDETGVRIDLTTHRSESIVLPV